MNFFIVCIFGIYIFRRNAFFSHLNYVDVCFKTVLLWVFLWQRKNLFVHAGDITQIHHMLATKWRRIWSDTTLDG
jgi:hypothetical protein